MKSSKIPSVLLAFIAKQPLLKGDNPEHYYAFVETVYCDMQPRDVVDGMWTIRFAYAAWTAMGLRRLRAAYLNGQCPSALLSIIREKLGAPPTLICEGQIINAGAIEANKREAEAFMQRLGDDPAKFAEQGIDPELVPAKAVVMSAKSLQIFDQMIDREDRNCDSIVQQLDVRQSVFASQAREVAVQILREQTLEPSEDGAAAEPTAEAGGSTNPGEKAPGEQGLQNISSPPVVPEASPMPQEAAAAAPSEDNKA